MRISTNKLISAVMRFMLATAASLLRFFCLLLMPFSPFPDFLQGFLFSPFRMV
nr:MAG TPA: hypothetical protein [Caudoviricetes sp.]